MSISPKCSFRIIGMSEAEQSRAIEEYLSGFQYRMGADHQDSSKKILRLILEEDTSVELLINLLKSTSNDVYYDFFVSVSSDEQTAIIEIPEYVLELYKQVGGKICFSYTCIFGSN